MTQDHGYEFTRADGAGFRTLLRRLNRDATQLAHDELELARLELRQTARAFSSELKTAGRTVVRDLAKLGVALSLALLAGLALTAGAILGIGQLLGGAFWAGALIVGVVLLVAAMVAVKSAATDVQESDALRFEDTRDSLRHDKRVITEQVRETKQFAKQEAAEFKRHASPGTAN